MSLGLKDIVLPVFRLETLQLGDEIREWVELKCTQCYCSQELTIEYTWFSRKNWEQDVLSFGYHKCTQSSSWHDWELSMLMVAETLVGRVVFPTRGFKCAQNSNWWKLEIEYAHSSYDVGRKIVFQMGILSKRKIAMDGKKKTQVYLGFPRMLKEECPFR
jgi:hypothetical protein